jgi:hypothetical protein
MATRDVISSDGLPVMNDLANAVRELALCHVKSPALVVQTPEGGYAVRPDRSSVGAGNYPVISRSQLDTLMWQDGLRRKELTEPARVGELATIVASLCLRPRGDGWCGG